ncbi:MAG: MoaD/ThiS family protein [Chloroflexi bacterium]|nr:MoaD/ThiS family protein [Chloroflexota bacterium]
MPSTLLFRDKTYPVPSRISIRQALAMIGIDPQSVLPTRKDELVSEEELLQEGDEIKLVAVISGGAKCASTAAVNAARRR